MKSLPNVRQLLCYVVLFCYYNLQLSAEKDYLPCRDTRGINDYKADENDEIEKAYEQAMDAIKLKPNERIDKYYACVLSDEEMEDEDGKMEDDDEIVEIVNASDRKENGNDETIDNGDEDDDDDADMHSTKRVLARRISDILKFQMTNY